MNTKFLSLAVLAMCAPVSADASFADWNPFGGSQSESKTIVNNVVEAAQETVEKTADVVVDAASVATKAAKRGAEAAKNVVSTEEAPGRIARAFACIKAAPQAAWSATKSGVHAVIASPGNFCGWAKKFYWTEATGFQRSYRLTLTAALATAIGYGSYKAYEKYNTEKAA